MHNPLVATSSLNCAFFGSISRADFMFVHCNMNHESLSQASAFRNKKQNVSITYTTHLELFKVEKSAIFQNSEYTVVAHC